MLKVGGIYVSPAEVEAALVSHSAVLECAVVGHEDLPPYRFDEEHATYEADPSCALKVGDVVDFHLGYTPFAVNYFDAYHVVDDGTVTDIWPILPRGPLHGGLLAMLEAGR